MVDARAAARNFVRERYPGARVAFLGGSTASGAATATSDLDIFVLLGDEHDDVSFVETVTHQGWLVEAFVYGPVAAERWLRKGRDERRPVLDSLVATGVSLIESDEAQAWAARSRTALAAGPGEADAAEVDLRRYGLSGLVDDLEGGADPAEEYVIVATAFREASELALLVGGSWLGTGKWLVRNLRSGDDHGLVAWAAGDRDARDLAVICREVLDAAGGYLQDGFLRGERPPTTPS